MLAPGSNSNAMGAYDSFLPMRSFSDLMKASRFELFNVLGPDGGDGNRV